MGGFFGGVKGKLNFSFFLLLHIEMGEREEEIIIIIIGFGKKKVGEWGGSELSNVNKVQSTNYC